MMLGQSRSNSSFLFSYPIRSSDFKVRQSVAVKMTRLEMGSMDNTEQLKNILRKKRAFDVLKADGELEFQHKIKPKLSPEAIDYIQRRPKYCKNLIYRKKAVISP